MKTLRISLTLVILLHVSTFQVSAQSFKDVPFDHWAHDEIRFLTDKSVIRGFSDGLFKPLSTLTRKDAAVMIVRALKLPAVKNPSIKPSDLKPTMGGYKEMMIAANKGLLTIRGNKFNPNSPLTRDEMAKVLAVAYNFKGSGKSTFKDIPKSNGYYKYIDAIAENDITTGYSDGTYKPKIAVNRAQFSTFLKRVYDEPLQYVVKENGKTRKTFTSSEEAIAYTVTLPRGTVHPVSNSLMKYGSTPSSLSTTGIKNGVLIYNGAERATFSEEFFKPYLSNGGQTLFDTYIVLGRTYPNGEFAETSRNKANYKEWQWYMDTTFATDGALQGLNAAAKNDGKTVSIYVAIPYPKRTEAITKLNGSRVANTLKARHEWVNWYISTFEAKWKKAGFKNLQFKGYYWLNETVIHTEDEQLVTATAKRIHALNKKFIYAPHALTTNFENWKY